MAKKSEEAEEGLCPSCSAIVVAGARECPECGESLVRENLVEVRPGGLMGKMSALLFWVGLGLVVIGGPGLALGSWLHDALRINIGGTNFDYFGPLNRFVAAAGLIVLIVGIVLLIASIRFTRPVVDDDYDVGTPKGA